MIQGTVIAVIASRNICNHAPDCKWAKIRGELPFFHHHQYATGFHAKDVSFELR